MPAEPPVSIKGRVELTLSLATVIQGTSITEELVVQTHSHVTTAPLHDDSCTDCHCDCLLHTGCRSDYISLSFTF